MMACECTETVRPATSVKTKRAGSPSMFESKTSPTTSPFRLITGLPEWLNWLLVFLPMVTGYMLTHHLFFPYEVLFSLHMLAVDGLLIWIPFSRISHFMFYFFARAFHGAEFGKRAVMP